MRFTLKTTPDGFVLRDDISHALTQLSYDDAKELRNLLLLALPLEGGDSRRDEFVRAALEGVLAAGYDADVANHVAIAKLAVGLADATIAALEQRRRNPG